MTEIIECVPNFSEGRDQGVISALARAAEGAAGAALLDYSADADHNRSVFTLLGSAQGVAEAAFRMCAASCDMIDMTKHTGAHPRIGAADVVPFVPVRGCVMAECVEISQCVAERIYNELAIPCFLYGESGAGAQRRELASIRRGGFEGMPQKLLLDGWAPDYGERRIHPTAGATAVGARKPLVAFNVNLATSEVRIARRIAKKIRESNGGFKHCMAMGIFLGSQGIAQVSMNLTDCDVTPIHTVYEAICDEAARLGVKIAGSELIGLAPAKALEDAIMNKIKIDNLNYGLHALENYIPKLHL